ncbi:hypothetical protein ACFZCF_15790 [Streptomyces sp. NPDC007945]|uniref:hypothetical protein n=1 Tax=Streptomyces sp. NPDC007945 TaxID=3364797 RepID=UPI0036EFA790
MVEFSAGNTGDPGDYCIGEKLNMPGGYMRRMDNPAADGRSLSRSNPCPSRTSRCPAPAPRSLTC